MFKIYVCFSFAYKLEPKNKDWHFELASAYLLNNQARNAIKVYDELEKHIGSFGVLFQQKKQIYIDIGDKIGAIRELEKWAEAESQKDAYLGGYSEEHIKQMTDERHNQWGVAGEPKKTRVQ